MKFKVVGLAKLNRDLDKAAKDLERGTDVEIKNFADEVLSAALARIPTDRGILRASSVIEKINGGYVVAFNAKYSPYIEFGTGEFVEIPNGLEAEARQFFVNGKGITRAQPFLFPYYLANKESMVTELANNLNNYIKSF